jgi:hypothetical protein
MTKASDSAEPFGPERLDLSSSTGLKAEGLVAGHQSLRKDVMTFFIIGYIYPKIMSTHFPDESFFIDLTVFGE